MPENSDRNQLLDGDESLCDYHGDGKDTEGHDCPFGGDIANDCADCVYSVDYHYDYDEEDCIARP